MPGSKASKCKSVRGDSNNIDFHGRCQDSGWQNYLNLVLQSFRGELSAEEEYMECSVLCSNGMTKSSKFGDIRQEAFMKFYQDNSLSIGRTPLVKINRIITGKDITVLAKVEGRNPAYSVKCRIGASMVWDAEKKGLLGPGREILEATSGNTGIALAFVAASRNYPITIVMPETMSMERRKVLKALGAKLILTEGSKGMTGAIARADEMAKNEPERFVLLNQFKNPANPAIHRETTGPEIWDDTGGKIDVLISGVGTGGSITGISQYIKHDMGKAITSVAVEPAASPVITQTMKGEKPSPSAHKIQGIGAGFIPETLDLSIVDRVVTVTNEEAMDFARRLAREEGILSGISCGAAMAAAAKLAEEPEMTGKVLVVILPDSGERYLSTPLFEGIGE